MNVVIVNQPKEIRKIWLKKSFLAVQQFFLKKSVRNRKILMQKKEITLVFLTKNEMKKTNFRFRQKNKPTDVLSFSSDDPDSLGELLFCLDVLKMQAAGQGQSLNDELLYMMIHGLLHLLGYDHEVSKKEETLMFRLQDDCFRLLNSEHVTRSRIIRS